MDLTPTAGSKEGKRHMIDQIDIFHLLTTVNNLFLGKIQTLDPFQADVHVCLEDGARVPVLLLLYVNNRR